MSKAILDGLTIDELLLRIDEVVKVRLDQAIDQIKKQEVDKLITINAACSLFCPTISRQTLYNYEKQTGIPRQMIGRSVYFRQSDVLNMAKQLNKIVRTEKPAA